eukprot:scaffold295262_cov19-Tisochrysis_lutea.AAC.1
MAGWAQNMQQEGARVGLPGAGGIPLQEGAQVGVLKQGAFAWGEGLRLWVCLKQETKASTGEEAARARPFLYCCNTSICPDGRQAPSGAEGRYLVHAPSCHQSQRSSSAQSYRITERFPSLAPGMQP